MTIIPPKPSSRDKESSLWRYMQLFRRDILSAQPAKLYRAWMAEFKTPFFRSYLCNDPALITLVLKERPDDFPKSNRIREGLTPILGNSVFVTNGDVWKRQRRIIDPAFEGGRLHDTFPAIWDATEAAIDRLSTATNAPIEIEEPMSHAAADVIFRTLFSIPISNDIASRVFHEFQAYQRSQPILNLAAFIALPQWFPRFYRRSTRKSAHNIRELITSLTQERAEQIARGNAPNDLATKIMQTPDPVTGQYLDTDEMVDQVAIFFLAGHETSASALSWALYLVATHPEVQERIAKEAESFPDTPDFSALSKLKFTRDVFRETLRLYPPVPMMVRQTIRPEVMRKRPVPSASQIVLSPWHLQRHEKLWENPDQFNPERWQKEESKTSIRDAYMPFSAGPRVCIGAGFAMIEGVLMLAKLVKAFHFSPVGGHTPTPIAHLTVRSKDGILLRIRKRENNLKKA